MQNEDNNSSTQSPNDNKKTKMLLITSVVILLAALVGLSIYHFMRTEALNAEIEQLKSSQANQPETVNDDSDDSTEPSEEMVVEYREIPEFGVKYQLTDETKDLTYSHLTDNGVESLGFSTTAIASLGEECSSENAPSGMISRYADGSTRRLPGEQPVSEIGRKVGDYYFTMQQPQAQCMVNGEVAPGLDASIDAVRAAYESFEVL